MRLCAIYSCARVSRVKELCQNHYQQLHLYGTGTRQHKKSPTDLRTRFTQRYGHCTVTGCWLWIGSKNTGGYGDIKDPARGMLRAHRLSWELAYGPIPIGKWVLHKCDRPICVNPSHLFLGSQTDNMRDMAFKKRYSECRGAANHSAKLTEHDVIAIRGSDRPPSDLARQHNVSRGCINLIMRRTTWSHI